MSGPKMGKKMRRKKRKVPITFHDSAKMFHEGRIAGANSRKKPLRNTKKGRARILRLGRAAAEKLAKGTIGMNLAKKRAKARAAKKNPKTTKRKRK